MNLRFVIINTNQKEHNFNKSDMACHHLCVLRDKVPQVLLLIYEQKNLGYPIAEHAHLYYGRTVFEKSSIFILFERSKKF